MADPAELIDHYRRAHFEVLYCQSSTNQDDKEAAQSWLEEAHANLLAALTPPPTPDAVALVDELVLCVSMAAQAKSGAERENHKRSAKEARTALLAAMRPTWQTIDTAPKDGTQILASNGGSIPFVTSWDTTEEFWFTFNLCFEKTTGGASIYREWNPTHWMPIPASPEAPR